MLNKIINFIKYNNLTVLILAAIFLFSAGAFAQTETGQEAIGQKQTRVEGVDNSLLLAADLDNMDMDFKIEKIEEDEEYYYITYTFLDLDKLNNAWQYILKEKPRKVSKKLEGDLGVYLIEELGEEYEARIKELKEEKLRAEEQGEEKRVEITEYSGLIGKSLDLAAKVFPGYEAVKEREIASPELIDRTNMTNQADGVNPPNPPYEGGQADNLAEIYNNYIEEHAGEIAGVNPPNPPYEGGQATTTAEEDIFTATTTEEAVLPEPEAEPGVEIIELPAE